jgi:predicted dehydrogenase
VAFDVAGPQYTAQAEDFLNAVEGKNQNESIGADILSSYKVQSLIDALYLSAEKRGQPTQPTILKWD